MSLAILLVVRTGSVSSSDAEPGHDLAKAIAEIAKINGEVDIQALSHFLELPDLGRDLQWSGPSPESGATNWAASYTPPDSALGITKIALGQRTVQAGMLADKSFEFHDLVLTLKPGSCPSVSTLTEAIGIEALESLMLGYDGGPPYKVKWFAVPQSHGEPVMVTLLGDDTCHVEMTQNRFL
jgi:hypothetical protein